VGDAQANGRLNTPWTAVGGIHDRQVAVASCLNVMSPMLRPMAPWNTRHLAWMSISA
jgi:hypothetical protein